MFGELISWFGSRARDRREQPRTKKPFKVAYTLDGTTYFPAIGLDIGIGGISILAQHPFRNDEITIRLTLDTRIVPCRMAVTRHEPVLHGGHQVHKYAMKFVAMARDDQDAALRWLRGAPMEVPNKAQEELAAVRMTADDVARLFPKVLQDRLHEELVKRQRLAPIDDRVTPLVAYYYGGLTRNRTYGKPMHQLTIESKIARDHEHDELRYKTRFLFDETGQLIKVLD